MNPDTTSVSDDNSFAADAAGVTARLREEVPWLFSAAVNAGYEMRTPPPVIEVDATEEVIARACSEPRGYEEWFAEQPPVRFHPKLERRIAEILSRPFTARRVTPEVAEHNRKIIDMALRLAAAGYYPMPAHRPDPLSGCTAARTRYNRLARKGEAPGADWVANQRGRCKQPVGVDWPIRASCDLEDVWRNFNEYPAAIYKDGQKTNDRETRYIDFKVNLCIATGLRTGIFVIDVDGDDARQRLKELETERGRLPCTVQSLTGSGSGDHYVFRLPPGVELHSTASKFGSAGKEGTGIDIRGFHGQIIIDPSLHKSGGHYRWLPGKSPFGRLPATAPRWTLDEAIACSKVARREEAERNGTAPATAPARRPAEDVEADYAPRGKLAAGTANRVAQIGYGEGTAGCIHHAVFSAILSRLAERGYEADTVDLETAIRERLEAVVASRPDKQHYLDRAYLPRRVEEARGKAKEWGYSATKAWAFDTLEEANDAIDQGGKKGAQFVIERIAVSPKLSAVHIDQLAKKLVNSLDASRAAVVSTIRALRKEARKADSQDDDVVEEFNRHYAVYEGPSKVEVLALSRRPGKLPPQYDKPNFLNLTDALRVIGTTENGREITAGAEWFCSQERNVVTEIGFAPPGSPRLPVGTLNIWNGWPVLKDMSKRSDAELKAMCPRFMEHIENIVCAGDKVGASWLLDWVADIFQVPGHKAGTAVVLVGGQGGGKSTLYEVLADAFGGFDGYLRKTGSKEERTGQFSDHRTCKLLTVSEEVTFAGDKAAANTFKDETTSETQFVNTKFRSGYIVRDYSRYLYIANDVERSQSIGEDDRRYTVFHVADTMVKLRKTDPAKHRAYFTDLRAEMEGDGLPAFVELLRRRRYDMATIANAYETEAKRAMVRAQLDPGERYLIDSVMLGEFSSQARDPVATSEMLVPVAFENVVCHGGRDMVALPVANLRRHFQDAMKGAPERYEAVGYGSVRGIHGLLERLLGADQQIGSAKVGGEPCRCFFVPLLDDIRRALVARGYLKPEQVVVTEYQGNAGRWAEFGEDARTQTDAAMCHLQDAAAAGGGTSIRQAVQAVMVALEGERQQVLKYEGLRDGCDLWDRATASD